MKEQVSCSGGEQSTSTRHHTQLTGHKQHFVALHNVSCYKKYSMSSLPNNLREKESLSRSPDCSLATSIKCTRQFVFSSKRVKQICDHVLISVILPLAKSSHIIKPALLLSQLAHQMCLISKNAAMWNYILLTLQHFWKVLVNSHKLKAFKLD